MHVVERLRRNSCFVLHLNQDAALHEPLSTSSVYARASAPAGIFRLIGPGLLGRRSLQPSADTSLRCFTGPYHRQSDKS
jgi:hypothetical protein